MNEPTATELDNRALDSKTLDLKALLRDNLDFARNRALRTLDGLTEEQLRTAKLPSGWSPIAAIHHLAHDVERFWFVGAVAADPSITGGNFVDGWDVSTVTSAEVIAGYRAAIDESNRIIAATSLDAAPQWWPDFFGDFRMGTLAEIILHALNDTAAHAGQLDAVRELIDGTQFLKLTD